MDNPTTVIPPDTAPVKRGERGRFLPGHTGNPGGRAKKPRPLYHGFMAYAEEQAAHGVDIWKKLAEVIYKAALNEQPWAIELVDKHFGGNAKDESPNLLEDILAELAKLSGSSSGITLLAAAAARVDRKEDDGE